MVARLSFSLKLSTENDEEVQYFVLVVFFFFQLTAKIGNYWIFKSRDRSSLRTVGDTKFGIFFFFFLNILFNSRCR